MEPKAWSQWRPPPWPTSHVAMPAGQHLASYRLNQFGNWSRDSYKYPWSMEFTHATLYLFSTCKGSSLVLEAQAKPYRESSRVFARASELVSEIGELLYPYLSL
jgi:hypothetical protein